MTRSSAPPAGESTEHLDGLLSSLIRVMAGNFDVRLPVSDANDAWDGIHSAINITVEELGIRTRKLARSEQRFRAIFEDAGVPMAICDHDGRFTLTNGPLCEFLGYTSQELAEKRIVDVTYVEDLGVTNATISGPANRQVQIEKRYIKKDGTAVWGQLAASWLLDVDTGEKYAVALIYDITNRKRAEAEIDESRTLFKLLIESAGDAIFLHNDTDGALLEVNQAACASLGYTREEILALKVPDVEIQLTPKEVLPALDGPRGTTVLGRHRRKDGTEFPVEVSLRRCEYQGQNMVLGLARDISERARHEELRQKFIEGVVAAVEEERRRVAQELHDALGQKLTGLSVQLRTLEDSIDDPTARKRLGNIRALTESTIGEVAGLARRLRPPVLDDLGFVESIEELAVEFSRTHGVVTDVHVRGMDSDERLPPTVEIALYRIVQEALTNVGRHACAKMVNVLLDHRRDTVLLIIEDDGQGFDLDPVTGLARRGDSLGLPGMRERAALLGGGVKFESRPDAGTAVYVTIPLAET